MRTAALLVLLAVIHSTRISVEALSATAKGSHNLSAVTHRRCPEGWFGVRCQRRCEPHDGPYWHHTCDEDGAWKCMRGWTGRMCDRRHCPSCQYGRCDENFHCQCIEGFTGPNCDECVPAVGCVNGKCRNNTPQTCECLPGWSGRFCDIDTTFCDRRSPCAKSSKCAMTGSSSYECVCPEGKTGRFCGIDYGRNKTGDEICTANANICLNGGRCTPIDLPGAHFHCRCPFGYSGKWCEMAMCKEGVCLNGGVCSAIRGEKIDCRCGEGYRGDRCETPTPSPARTSPSHAQYFWLHILTSLVFFLIFLGVLLFILHRFSATLKHACGAVDREAVEKLKTLDDSRSTTDKNSSLLFHAAYTYNQKKEKKEMKEKNADDLFKVVMDHPCGSALSSPYSPRYSREPSFSHASPVAAAEFFELDYEEIKNLEPTTQKNEISVKGFAIV